MKSTLAVAAFFLAQPSFAQTQNGWLCIVDEATGVSYSPLTKRWRAANFKTGGKYLITAGKNAKNVWEVREFGKEGELPDAWCEQDFQSVFLHCKGFFGEFKFNRLTNRFLKTYLAGYWTYAPGVNETKEGNDTPVIEIGTCSSF